MASKPIELPARGRTSLRRQNARFAAGHNTIKTDEITARHFHAFGACHGSHERKLRLSDVKEMFAQTREHF
jgi:hypothetical protein